MDPVSDIVEVVEPVFSPLYSTSHEVPGGNPLSVKVVVETTMPGLLICMPEKNSVTVMDWILVLLIGIVEGTVNVPV